jgi:hypothetical protein
MLFEVFSCDLTYGRIAGRNLISELLNPPNSVLWKKTRCTSSSICSSPISSLRKTSLTKTRPLCQLMSPLLFTRRVWNDLGDAGRTKKLPNKDGGRYESAAGNLWEIR